MELTLQILLFLIIMLSGVIIGLYIFFKKYRSFMHQSFTCLVIGLSVWGASIVSLYLTHIFTFSAISFMSGAVWFFGLVCFAYSFPHGKKPSRSFLLVWAIPALGIFTLAPFNVFISSFSVDASGYMKPINNLTFFIPFLITFFLYLIYSAILIYKNYKAHKQCARYRMQFRYLFLGITVFVFSVVIFDTILPLFNIYKYNLIGPSTSIVFFVLTAYAIVRHELMDIRLVIQKGLIYLILVGFLGAIYAAVFQLIGYVLHQFTNINSLISAGFTMILGVFFLRPLEDYFRKKTDHIFFKDFYNYADTLERLSKTLHTHLIQADIISESSTILRDVFKTPHVCFDFSMTSSCKDGNIALSVPIVFHSKRIGALYLGHKRSGDLYSKSDKQLLETFTYQAAVALEKARLYEKVQYYNAQLERQVFERTAEIKKLQEDQKQAMIDISHNLQTPIAIIRGELEFLAESSSDVEKIQTVKNSLDRVSGFIRQLLHLARLENSIYTVTLAPLDIAELLRKQVEYFEVMAEDQGVCLSVNLPQSAVMLGDKRFLEELFTNIVVNALAYRRSDVESSITIRLIDGARKLIIYVEDNGIGISKKDLPHIFNRFYIGSGHAHKKSSGLGLAICKKIVEKHNGKITIESIEGKGTVVTLSFPHEKSPL